MVAYSFKKRFAAPILAGTKTQTIRAHRKRHARVGEELQLYTGMRTKQCKLITTARCVGVHSITLFLRDRLGVAYDGDAAPFIESFEKGRDGMAFSDAFATADGFADYADMCAFFTAEHPGQTDFDGVLIRWVAQ